MKVFVQNEKGSRTRNRYNEETLEFLESMELSCRLPLPYPYGFIPGTLGDDGDCIDFWVVTNGKFNRGEIVDCEVLGLMEFFEGDERDFKVLGRPESETIELTDEVFGAIREYTYEVFKQWPHVSVRVGDLLPREAAMTFLKQGGR